MEEVGHEKVLKYETFLNETLKADLGRVISERDKVYEELSEYLQLKNVIEKLQESGIAGQAVKTKVDLGCNFYVQANVPETRTIFVYVGYGFYVEFTLSEALKFINKKDAQLQDRSEKLSQEVTKVKAHIKIVLQGLRELQKIDGDPPEKEYRDVLS